MKRIIIAMALILGISVAAAAQPRAVGARTGMSFEASYQHTLGGENFLQGDLGYSLINGLSLTGTYNFMIAQPSWTPRGEWGIYAGPGITMGSNCNSVDAFNLSFVANAGIEFTFWFPLQLSVDLRPQFGFFTGSESGIRYNMSGFLGFVPSVSARYCF